MDELTATEIALAWIVGSGGDHSEVPQQSSRGATIWTHPSQSSDNT